MGVAIALAVAWAEPGRADWAYTHWGMTADQVIAASQGAASMMPAARQYRSDDGSFEITVQAKSSDPLVFEVGFQFDRPGGLSCVVYNAVGDKAERLRAQMVKTYGKPAKESTFMSTETLSWKTPDSIELTTNTNPPAAVVNHCAPGRS